MGAPALDHERQSFSRVDPLNDPEWDREVSKIAGATFFHSSHWGRVLWETYGYQPYYHRFDGAGRRIFLCLSEIDSWITGKRGVSLPFSDECPILGLERGDAEMCQVME